MLRLAQLPGGIPPCPRTASPCSGARACSRLRTFSQERRFGPTRIGRIPQARSVRCRFCRPHPPVTAETIFGQRDARHPCRASAARRPIAATASVPLRGSGIWFDQNQERVCPINTAQYLATVGQQPDTSRRGCPITQGRSPDEVLRRQHRRRRSHLRGAAGRVTGFLGPNGSGPQESVGYPRRGASDAGSADLTRR